MHGSVKDIEESPGLVNYAMIWIKEPFINDDKLTKDVFISE